MENQNIMEISTIMGIPEPSGSDGLEESEYQRTVDTVFKNIRNLKQSFVLIGWCLCRIKEKEWFLKEDCRDIYQFAQRKFQFSQSTTSRCMGLWKMFSKDGDTPELDAKFDGYSVSQLIEMLPLEMEDLEGFNPGMTVQEIREKKKKILKERRKMNEGEDYEEDSGDEDSIFPTSQIKTDKDSTDTYIQPDLPSFRNDMERREWLGNFEAWGLWYEDENLGIRYYKYDFVDGSRLISVQYRYTCPPYMKMYPSKHKEQVEADGAYYGEPSYHMIYSDWYWERHEDEYGTDFQRYFTHSTVTVDALVDFLNELQDWEDSRVSDGDEYTTNVTVMQELDFDNLDRAESFTARQYAKFFKKYGYIPPHFNVKNGLEVVEYAYTLMEGCGSTTGMSATLSFCAEEEVVLLMQDEDMDKVTARRQIDKIRRIVKPEERYKVEQVLKEYGMRISGQACAGVELYA